MTDWPAFFREHLTPPKQKLAEDQAHARSLVQALGADEVQILNRLVAGWGSKEIASDLNLTLSAYEQRKQNVMTKLNAGSTSDLVRIGIYADLYR